jgi:hypothetical protein
LADTSRGETDRGSEIHAPFPIILVIAVGGHEVGSVRGDPAVRVAPIFKNSNRDPSKKTTRTVSEEESSE